MGLLHDIQSLTHGIDQRMQSLQRQGEAPPALWADTQAQVNTYVAAGQKAFGGLRPVGEAPAFFEAGSQTIGAAIKFQKQLRSAWPHC